MLKNLAAMLMALALVGCATVDTEFDYDENVDFTSLKTWAWIEPSTATAGSHYQMDGLNDGRVRKALSRKMGALGMRQVPASEAQVLVNYLTQVEKKIDVDTFYSDFGYYPYYRHRGPYWGAGVHADTRVREYKEGTLIVDMVDADTKALMWRGSGTDTLKKQLTPAERTEQVNEVVNAIFEGFPPGKQK